MKKVALMVLVLAASPVMAQNTKLRDEVAEIVKEAAFQRVVLKKFSAAINRQHARLPVVTYADEAKEEKNLALADKYIKLLAAEINHLAKLEISLAKAGKYQEAAFLSVTALGHDTNIQQAAIHANDAKEYTVVVARRQKERLALIGEIKLFHESD